MLTARTSFNVPSRLLASVSLCLSVGACGVGPKLGPFEAHAPPVRAYSIGAALLPTLAITGVVSANERLDVGATQEGLVSSAWLLYRLVNDPQGLAVAATLGAFNGDPEYDAVGASAGLVASYRRTPWTLSLAARAHTMDYTPADLDDPFNGHLAFPKITTDTLERYHSIELGVAFSARSGAALRVGVRCGDDSQTDFIDGVGHDVEYGCLPILALTL